ncbi:glycosyltransferase family 4 protein [Winogradskyella litorisediminis]|uniref:Glycosyltransferase family 4 protein n=1 Tax=Winogradskyella litorisediminis TaxID=1156618 RepID=A0ABW3NBI8_9FLAO
MKRVAILTPKSSDKAETFIRNHIDYLPFEKVIIHGGNKPYLLEGKKEDILSKFFFVLKNRIRNIFGLQIHDYRDYSLRKILKNKKIDLVFAEYLVTAAETLDVIRSLDIPLVTIALGYDISMYNILEKYKEKYVSLFEYASFIIVVSKHMSINLKLFNCPEFKIHYSPASPDKSFFEVQPHFQNKQLIAVGRFVEKKAPLVLINVFNLVCKSEPDANLIMAGDGPLLDGAKELAKDLSLENKIFFPGRISQEAQKKYLEDSYVFIQHSRLAQNGDSEGTPVAILEASAASLPIVSTHHAGIPNIVLHEHTGLLSEENDIETMAKNIIDILKSKDKAIIYGKNGKEFIQNNFSLEKHISDITNIINLV